MHDEIVFNHVKATAALLQRGLDELHAQVGAEAHERTAYALQRGAMLQAVTTLSLAGALHVTMNLIAPNGETVHLGDVHLDRDDGVPPAH